MKKTTRLDCLDITMCVALVRRGDNNNAPTKPKKIRSYSRYFPSFFLVSFLIYRRSKDDKDKPRYVCWALVGRSVVSYNPAQLGILWHRERCSFFFPFSQLSASYEERVYLLPLMSRRMTHSRARETLLCVLMGRETLLLAHQQQASLLFQATRFIDVDCFARAQHSIFALFFFLLLRLPVYFIYPRGTTHVVVVFLL